jgi:RsiW-degrading membrane proteinase PrsW (M82 family)
MSVAFNCPFCQKGLKAPETLVGRRARCPKCKQKVTVPDAVVTDMPTPAIPENESANVLAFSLSGRWLYVLIAVSFLSLLGSICFYGIPLPAGLLWLSIDACAAVSVCVILLAYLLPRGNSNPKQGLLIALTMATGGFIFLLTMQYMGYYINRIPHIRRYSIINGSMFFMFIYLMQFISLSYTSTIDPHSNLLLAFAGFTFGMGLCEELTKALPMFFHVRGKNTLDWQGACYWGLASGIGFGLTKNIFYSINFNNGGAVSNADLLMIFPNVALQAIWCAAASLMIWRCRHRVEESVEHSFLLDMLWVLCLPMLLHGLYETCLQAGMYVAALTTGLISIGWLIVLIETTRRREITTEPV